MDTYEEAWRKGIVTSSQPTTTTWTTRCSGRRGSSLCSGASGTPWLRPGSLENAKGECNFGQHEINFKFDRALTTADGHAIYKNGAKEIAAQEGYSISFMPKFDEREETPATST